MLTGAQGHIQSLIKITNKYKKKNNEEFTVQHIINHKFNN